MLCPSSIAVFGAGCPRDEHAAGDGAQADDDVRRDQGHRRAALRLLRQALRRRRPRPALPGHHLAPRPCPAAAPPTTRSRSTTRRSRRRRYTCFVREDTRLPMMYMPDCIKATIDLMEADFDKLKHHGDFNVGAMSFTRRRAGRRDPEAHPRVRGHLRARLPPGDRRLLAAVASTTRRPARSGAGNRTDFSTSAGAGYFTGADLPCLEYFE